MENEAEQATNSYQIFCKSMVRKPKKIYVCHNIEKCFSFTTEEILEQLDADLSEVEGDLSRHSSHSDMDLEGCTLEEETLDDTAPMPSPMEQEQEQAFRG